MTEIQTIKFTDNPVILNNRDRYLDVDINVEKALKSWQISLYSFQWMHSDGRIKNRAELPEEEQALQDKIEDRLKNGGILEKPVLGIGLLENVEIGSGRATFLTLAAKGIKTIPVHIPKSHQKEFSLLL